MTATYVLCHPCLRDSFAVVLPARYLRYFGVSTIGRQQKCWHSAAKGAREEACVLHGTSHVAERPKCVGQVVSSGAPPTPLVLAVHLKNSDEPLLATSAE